MRIYYTDGASLIIKSTEVDAVDYFRPSPGGGGAWVSCMWHRVVEINFDVQVTFSKAQMPEEVMRRMGSVPRSCHFYSFHSGSLCRYFCQKFHILYISPSGFIVIHFLRVIEALLGQHIPPRPASVR